MQKIVTDPLYIRCKKVLESCETKEQYNVAKKYWASACVKAMPDFHFDVSEYLTYMRLWESLVQEGEWN